jgi:hypothetical protein
MTRLFATSLLLIASTSILSCSSKNDSPSAVVTDWTAGRGTAACHEWQRASCEWAARCNARDVAQCAAQYQEIECNSDTTATNCATSFDAAACTTLPANCGMTDLANAAPAIQGCTDFFNALCARDATCGSPTPTATCVTQTETASSIDCSLAIGLSLNFQDCLTQINTLSCNAAAQPAVCTKSILFPGP